VSESSAAHELAVPPLAATGSEGETWWRAMIGRLLVVWPLKVIGTPLFVGLFFVAYFWILRHPAHPLVLMPVTGLDRLIGFQIAALPVYLTLWLYVSLPPALLAGLRELVTYGVVVAVMCFFALACFVLWPTAVPPSLLDDRSGAGIGLVAGIDASGNACPSLHVAAALFSGVWLDRLFGRIGAPALLRFLNGLWCAGIIYSTMATKQHVVYDVLGGLVLGALMAAASFYVPALSEYRARRVPRAAGGEP
jgi:hypothetical protein